MMKKNMGTTDKAIRILVALLILVLYLANVVTGTLGLILIIVAIVLAVTSLIGVCPLYIPFGISTLKKGK
ncbi:MAG: DUF2892 domain-containing protein [Bacteroidales bacterium]|jgi:hypothetical protein|nr:DUF2892 domain-containing protein [Bacteroidales bacterium]